MADARGGAVLLPDVNVLLAAAVPGDPRRLSAVGALWDADSWVTTPATESGFLRLAMNSSVPGGGLPFDTALGALRGLRAHPSWRFLPDDASAADPMIDHSPLVGHRQVPDFHLVDLAARHGALFATFDARVPGGLAPADRRHVRVLSV